MKKVAIIGAGISGLFIANLFKNNSNYEIKIFEKDNLINLKNKLISLTYLMVKIVLPVIILLLIVIFWKKIEDYFYQKFKFKINYIIVTISIIALSILGLLLYD